MSKQHRVPTGKETTKVCIVFEALTKKRNEPSRNDCLYVGPCLLRQLHGILGQFRLRNIILMSGMKQAFVNVVICGEH